LTIFFDGLIIPTAAAIFSQKTFSPDVAFKENKSLSGKSYKSYTCATLQIDEEMNKARQYSSGSNELPGSSSWSHLRECFLFFLS
jgi:hypothetical protein